jgi:murein L,D-transpeptidase YcbB/YkuD
MGWRCAFSAVVLGAAAIASAPVVRASGGPDASARDALRTVLEAGTDPDLAWADLADCRAAAARFYEAREWELAWVRDGRPTDQARALARALAAADRDGLDARDYAGPSWALLVDALDAATPAPGPTQARFDLALTVSALRYASDLRDGRIRASADPEEVGRVRLVRAGPDDDVAAFVRGLASAPDVPAALARAEPPFAAYRRTVAALRRYAALAREEGAERIAVPRRPVGPGEPLADAGPIARRLRLVGDLAADAATPEDRYDAALADAVARFQRRHGLDPTGRLDARTVRSLNVPLSARADQLRLTLERWRWLPRDLASPPLVVNIPEFRLRGADPARRLSMKVVVGRAYERRTPVFAAEATRVVFRPAWIVPLKIQREELVPRIAKDPGFLAEEGYEVLDRRRRVVPLPSGPAALQRLRTGALRLRQVPGPRNALGLVELTFRNPHGVAMHGTPSQEQFARSRRDFSHGCIRVEDPAALAAWALRDDPAWTPERIRAAMDGAQTVVARLPRPIPVLVLYGTAIVSEEGEVSFFEDLYGRDAALDRALRAEAERRAGRAP